MNLTFNPKAENADMYDSSLASPGLRETEITCSMAVPVSSLSAEHVPTYLARLPLDSPYK